MSFSNPRLVAHHGAMVSAVVNDNPSAVSALINRFPNDRTVFNNDEFDAIKLAVILDRPAILRRLMSHGLSISVSSYAKNLDGQTAIPLHLAIWHGRLDMLSVLIDPVTINWENDDGESALDFALVERGPTLMLRRMPIVDLLLARGARVTCLHPLVVPIDELFDAGLLTRYFTSGSSLVVNGAEFYLETALTHQRIDIFKVLVDQLIDEGYTPEVLSHRVRTYRDDGNGLLLEAYRYLIEKSFEPEWNELINGKTILHLWIQQGSPIDDLLALDRFNVNLPDQRGRTPLMLAVRANNLPAVVQLLQADANRFAKDLRGKTARAYFCPGSMPSENQLMIGHLLQA